MPSPVNGWRLKMGVLADQTNVSANVAHGLPAAPTFILAQSSLEGETVEVIATATTLSLQSSSDETQTISYLIAVE
jgi:hypothetical protein